MISITARNNFYLQHVGLAVSIASRYTNRSNFDDVSQAAKLGLLKASEKFNTDRNVTFSSYAIPVVRGEIISFFRASYSDYKIPIRWRNEYNRIKKIEEKWIVRNHRSPSDRDMVRITGISIGRIRLIEAAIFNQKASPDVAETPNDLYAPTVYDTPIELLEGYWDEIQKSYFNATPEDRRTIDLFFFNAFPVSRYRLKSALDRLHERYTQ